MTISINQAYGFQDTSFQAAGGVAGVERLVNCFYDTMEQRPEAQVIRTMHPDDLTASRDKLARFLCGWLGGPRRYNEKYGPINIPAVHRKLGVGSAERDAWLACMQHAVDEQPYQADFKQYLMQQLAIPADRIREVCSKQAPSTLASDTE